ncbi:MAG: tetratricopeptide repeat protein, partial [Planctomycetota bacterium]|nr:tetratricopeptide repeat protein [Planctomycetota bacterium]
MTPTAQPENKPPRRRWLRRLVLTGLVAIVVAGAVEGGLRVCGYGYRTSLTLMQAVDGADRYVPNPTFGWQFMPREYAPSPAPFSYPVHKAERTVRIFVAGGAAAKGEPDPAFGLARMLQVALAERYSLAKFEVINVAMPYADSQVVAAMVDELVGQDADMLIVCVGNDEVAGPGGIGNPVSPPPASGPVTQAKRWLRRSRTWQLVSNVMWEIESRRGAAAKIRPFEELLDVEFRASDPKLEGVYSRLAANLETICRKGQEAKLPIVLVTAPVNLRDFSPLASLHRESLGARQKEDWQRAWEAGLAHEGAAASAKLHGAGPESQRQYDLALASYQAAAGIDDEYADLQFRLARCLRELGRPGARERFLLARDLDTLRLRADSKINDTIRSAASAAGEGVTLADAEEFFRQSADDGIPGAEWFYDGTRMSFRGTWRLAAAVLPAVGLALPAWAGRPAPGGMPDELVCAHQLCLTSLDQMRMAEWANARLERAPLRGKSDERDAAIRLAGLIRQLKDRLQDGDIIAKERAMCEQALALTPADPMLQERFGLYLLKVCGQDALAETHLREAVRLGEPSAQRWLAQAMVNQKRYEDAAACLREVLKTQTGEDWVNTQVQLGEVLLVKGGARQAIEHLRAAVDVRPDDAMLQCELAKAYDRSGRAKEALEGYQKALALNPGDRALLNKVAWTLATSYDPKVRDPDKARELAEDLCRRSNRQDAQAL